MSNFIIPDAVFDSLDWQSVKGSELGILLTGCKIIGAEPIVDSVNEDGDNEAGVCLYLDKPESGIIAFEAREDYGDFILEVAKVPP